MNKLLIRQCKHARLGLCLTAIITILYLSKLSRSPCNLGHILNEYYNKEAFLSGKTVKSFHQTDQRLTMEQFTVDHVITQINDGDIYLQPDQRELDDLESELKELLILAPEDDKIVSMRKRLKEPCTYKLDSPKCNESDSHCYFQQNLPVDLRERLKQLVYMKKLQIPEQYEQALRDMRSKVHGNYETVITSALSSNHYHESLAMLTNVHATAIPVLKNFTFVVYDLGLTAREATVYRRRCKCTLLTFPFDKFPKHVKNIHCYSWKPLILRAHYPQTNLIIWMDASMRFINQDSVLAIIERVKRQQIIVRRDMKRDVMAPFFTLNSLFYFFQDSPCAYRATMIQSAGWMAYARSAVVHRAVHQPLVSCALQKMCMCPRDPKKVIRCKLGGSSTFPGSCHRFEQSTVALILGKLFHEKYDFWSPDIRDLVKHFRLFPEY